ACHSYLYYLDSPDLVAVTFHQIDLVEPPAPVFRFWHTAKRLSSIDPTDSTGFSSIDSTDSSDSSIRKQGGCWCLWVAVINPWALCLMEYHGVYATVLLREQLSCRLPAS